MALRLVGIPVMLGRCILCGCSIPAAMAKLAPLALAVIHPHNTIACPVKPVHSTIAWFETVLTTAVIVLRSGKIQLICNKQYPINIKPSLLMPYTRDQQHSKDVRRRLHNRKQETTERECYEEQ